ncbi:putative membrane protein YccC [Saccharopolyspora lacisalsi]|uniref:Putative membrane protein YccC n=1 Tax=Halosaccharopolyspora lacisalsi TaxID=1000566 RepID=A0A839DYV6_9PSEU|nr:FUSC family protein [Halosaccharopolyspora lacisalsi]MBA8826674.1 putative membrane protein YccC [Halosaccharopolyspora lacisalsi]
MKRIRELLATEAGAPDPRQHQYTVMVVLAAVVTTAAGWALDLRTPALIAGLTAVFTLVGAGGQSLRADLRRFVRLAPVLVLVMAGGPLLLDVPVLAGLFVAVIVFGAGMLPALGEHHRIVGQTVAAATLVSTTTSIGTEQSPPMLVGSAVLGALFALLLRIVLGLGDPTRATRAAVARTLVQPGPGVIEQSAAVWRADGGVTWLGQVLAGAARFRAARETLLAQAQRANRTEADRLRQIVAEADLVADELAKAVRSRSCTGLPSLARMNPADSVVQHGTDVPDTVRGINEGLHRVRSAVIDRDTTSTAPATPGGTRQRASSAVRAHLSFRSSLFRHASRCTLAVAAGLVLVFLMHDPSASTLLLSLYVVLQPAARDSMNGALERTGGAVLGVTALAVVITLLPGVFLLVPVAIGVMLLGVDQLRGDYRLLLGALIGITVGDQAMGVQRSLVDAAISFAANTAIGAAVALVVGFVSYVVLPGSLVPDVRGTVRATVWSLSELLRSVRAAGRGVEPRQALRSAHVLALRRTQDLLGMPALLEGADGAEIEHGDEATVREAAVALDALRQDLATLVFRPDLELAVAVPALQAVDTLLGGDTTATIPDVPSSNVPATELLASSLLENALHARAAIDQTLGYPEPWKSYTISFVRPERLHIR